MLTRLIDYYIPLSDAVLLQRMQLIKRLKQRHTDLTSLNVGVE